MGRLIMTLVSLSNGVIDLTFANASTIRGRFFCLSVLPAISLILSKSILYLPLRNASEKLISKAPGRG